MVRNDMNRRNEMPMSAQVQEAVRKAVRQEPPLGSNDVHGLDPHLFPDIFISRMNSYHGWPVIGSVEMSKDDVISVFQVQAP